MGNSNSHAAGAPALPAGVVPISQPVCNPADPSPRIVGVSQNENHLYLDCLGRERMFHGFNVVTKGYPWLPQIRGDGEFDFDKSFSNVDFQILSNLGANLVRFGVMWPGVEATRGFYNTTYLDALRDIAVRMQKYGIQVLWDFHEDGLHPQYCGEGIPDWAVVNTQFSWNRFPFPLQATPFNLVDGAVTNSDCDKVGGWGKASLSYATSYQYQALYDNANGIRDSFVNFWALAASKLGDLSNTLGYNLMNEPWAGDIYKNPSLLIPGIGDNVNLQPFYATVTEQIRRVDTYTIALIEPMTISVAVGFTDTPGGGAYKDRTALSYHYYSDNQPFGIDFTMSQRRRDMDRLNIGGLMTEFPGASRNIEVIVTADKYLQSWTAWDYKGYVDITGSGPSLFNPSTGEIYPDLKKIYSRPYPHAIAGRTKSFSYNDTTSVFEFSFIPDTTINAPTEIFLQFAQHFPNGVDIAITPPDAVRTVLRPKLVDMDDGESKILELWNTPGILKDQVVMVVVSAK